MSLLQLFIIAVGLSMDAFAVSICKGLSMRKISIKKAGIVGLYFGIFQAGMPLIGYFLGSQFQSKISFIDHWIAFVLLGIIGVNLIRESRKNESEVAADLMICENADDCLAYRDSDDFLVNIDTDDLLVNKNMDDPLAFKNMSALAIATSIDALAVGVTFACLQVNIFSAVSFIGIVTFTLSMIGVKIGNAFGTIYKSKAEFAGGLILIFMGTKILLDHIGMSIFS